VKLKELFAHTTLRQMADAEDIWREYRPDGGKLNDALSENNYRAIAALVAAKMRADGNPDATIEDGLDVEIDQDTDPGEVKGNNGGVPPRLLPATGS
jgi:hypothetical protein